MILMKKHNNYVKFIMVGSYALMTWGLSTSHWTLITWGPSTSHWILITWGLSTSHRIPITWGLSTSQLTLIEWGPSTSHWILIASHAHSSVHAWTTPTLYLLAPRHQTFTNCNAFRIRWRESLSGSMDYLAPHKLWQHFTGYLSSGESNSRSPQPHTNYYQLASHPTWLV